MTDAYISLLPTGSAWEFEYDGDTEAFIEAIGENWLTPKSYLEELACVRDPLKTPLLSDLEKEYGILKDTRISEDTRRNQLATKVYQDGTIGFDGLQKQLQDAGFDVQVHTNDPAVDPAIFLDQNFQMVAGGGNAYAGRSDAFCAREGGELLVNGEIKQAIPDYAVVCGNAYAGNTDAVAGYFMDFTTIDFEYTISTDPDAWPFYFFVGGDATRDSVTNELLTIEGVVIPAERENEFKNIILSFKPLHSWAGLIVSYG